MIIIMERDATLENVQAVKDLLQEHGFQVLVKEGDVHTVIDALGDKTTLSPGRIDAMEGVKQIKFIREPFRLASRDRKSEDTVIEFENGVKIGGANRPVAMVGPCSVEDDYEGLRQVAFAALQQDKNALRYADPRLSQDTSWIAEEAAKQAAREAGEERE